MYDQSSATYNAIHALSCSVNRHMYHMYKSLLPINPSEVLRALSDGTKYPAHSYGEFIHLMKCSRANVTVLPTLITKNGKLSAKPIFRLDNMGRNLYGQLNADATAYLGITYLDNGQVNVTRVFRVGEHYLRYKNGMLVSVNASVTKIPFDLNLKMSELPESMVDHDFSETFMYLFERLDLGRMSDYSQTLSHISQTMDLRRSLARLSERYLTTDEKTETKYDLLFPLEKVADAIQNSILSTLSHITNPIFRTLLEILTCITLFWGFYFTICAFVRASVMCRRQPLVDTLRHLSSRFTNATRRSDRDGNGMQRDKNGLPKMNNNRFTSVSYKKSPEIHQPGNDTELDEPETADTASVSELTTPPNRPPSPTIVISEADENQQPVAKVRTHNRDARKVKKSDRGQHVKRPRPVYGHTGNDENPGSPEH